MKKILIILLFVPFLVSGQTSYMAKSVNGTNADATGNVTIAVGGAQTLSRTFADSISLSISGSNTVKLPYAVDSVGATSDSIIVYKFGIRKSYTNGSGGGSSDFVLISTQTASSSATIDFTGLTSTYSSYKVVVSGVYPATNNAVLWMRIGTGGTPTYQSGASDYAYTSSVIPYAQIGGASGSVGGYASVADTKIILSNPIKNAVLRPYNAEIKFYDPSQSASYHNIRAEACAWDSDTYLEGFFLNASYLSATSITAIRFLMSTGNIAGGTFKLYGIK